ncbi:hypothetical protein [Acidocella sp.]|jgi:hypothetical protein|uniref:hypothetical protein n=1 Tax=Acidocella sp. TaxID=50710 RepID=UPI002F3FF5C7
MTDHEIARALGNLEGSFDALRSQNAQQHSENREALNDLQGKVADLTRAKNLGLGIVAGISLAGGALGGKLGAIFTKLFN